MPEIVVKQTSDPNQKSNGDRLQQDRVNKDLYFQCNQCYKVLKTKNSLNAHMKFRHNGKKVKCNICDKELSDSNNLLRHQKIFHEENQASNCYQNVDQNGKDFHLTSWSNQEDKEQTNDLNVSSNISSKVKKGMWIVKLDRLKKKDFT